MVPGSLELLSPASPQGTWATENTDPASLKGTWGLKILGGLK